MSLNFWYNTAVVKAVMTFLALCALVSPLWGLTSQPYSRYQPIVDRQMFGPLPVGFDPDKLPSDVARPASEKQLTKEQEEIKKSIRFMAINKSSDGSVMVGFADFANPKNPVTYYLRSGESQGDWTVREADPETAVMTIVNKEGVEVTLTLGGDSSKDAGAVSVASTTAAAPDSPRLNLLGGKSLRNRRLQREAQIAAEKERDEKERAEREAVREQQRQAEREESRLALQSLKDEIQRMRTSQSATQQKDSEKATTTEKEVQQ